MKEMETDNQYGGGMQSYNFSIWEAEATEVTWLLI